MTNRSQGARVLDARAEILKLAKAVGWSVELARGGHLRLRPGRDGGEEWAFQRRRAAP
jgi:hypothetical protein